MKRAKLVHETNLHERDLCVFVQKKLSGWIFDEKVLWIKESEQIEGNLMHCWNHRSGKERRGVLQEA